jgi:hypothetical protein
LKASSAVLDLIDSFIHTSPSIVLSKIIPSMEDSNLDDMFFSAQEAFSQELEQEQRVKHAISSSPFQSSCSPIPSKERPRSVRAMVKAMEEQKRQQHPASSPSPQRASINQSSTTTTVQVIERHSPSPRRTSTKQSPTSTTSTSQQEQGGRPITEHIPRRASFSMGNANDTKWSKPDPRGNGLKGEERWSQRTTVRSDRKEVVPVKQEQAPFKHDDDGYISSSTATDDEEYETVYEGRNMRSLGHSFYENQKPINRDGEVRKDANSKPQLCYKSSKDGAPLQVATNTGEELRSQTENRCPKTPSTAYFSEGTIVQVQARTWPGINQLGGVATVLKAHINEEGLVSYDVQYVLDRRKEKQVDSTFVAIQEDFMNDSTLSNGSRRRSPRTKQERPSPQGPSSEQSKAANNTKKSPGRLDTRKSSEKRKSSDNQDASKRQKSPRFVVAAVQDVNKMTAEELCKLADEFYRQRIRAAFDKGVVYVCGSGLGDADEKALKDLAGMNELNGTS